MTNDGSPKVQNHSNDLNQNKNMAPHQDSQSVDKGNSSVKQNSSGIEQLVRSTDSNSTCVKQAVTHTKTEKVKGDVSSQAVATTDSPSLFTKDIDALFKALKKEDLFLVIKKKSGLEKHLREQLTFHH